MMNAEHLMHVTATPHAGTFTDRIFVNADTALLETENPAFGTEVSKILIYHLIVDNNTIAFLTRII